MSEKILTKEIAEKLMAKNELSLDEELEEFISIQDDAAESLSKYPGFAIYFKSLQSLTVQSAESLSKFKHCLGFSEFDGFGEEVISGIQSISPDVAKALSSHRGGVLYLDSLNEINDDVARYLALWSGASVALDVEEKNGITLVFLGPDAGNTTQETTPIRQFRTIKEAEEFINIYRSIKPGDLLIRGIKQLSDQAAQYFEKSKAMIYFRSDIKMSDDAAKRLANREVGINKYMASEWVNEIWEPCE